MKKIIILLMILLSSINIVQAQNSDFTPNALSSVLIDHESNQILFEKAALEKHYPASTTKIMTLILIYEALNDQSIALDEIVNVSKYAASMGGSQVYLEENEKMSVNDLIKSIAIASANDACVAMGEYIASSNEKFVAMMNEKAQELKLKKTNFVNPTGLHDDNHYTCALDLAIMASYLIEIGGDKLLEITSTYDSYIRENTSQPFWLVNTNKLLKQYEGIDGLKTGFTTEAGYCLVSTAKKDGMRLIGVVMGEPKPTLRNEEMMQMLDYGFQNFKVVKLHDQNSIIDQLKIHTRQFESIDICNQEAITYLVNRQNKAEIKTKIKYQNTQLPLKKNQIIGYFEIYQADQLIHRCPLYPSKDVVKDSFISNIIYTLKNAY